ncbi:hypothetical protein [Aquabacterium sp. CECT 9606]|uniref:hypothetical protein n=1 Tax=Aquabacterium sp. CECT 9606 TaxID=2845822 RepID=UPI001E4165A3|nr:hypothetical protein [Aquabacterium sp. CECT 9606]CAH0351461.1 hypothetical protein AQB9606_02123 [Aquabacterium sp. CECT 9606]
MQSNPHDLDGVDLWFFGGTPGPDDLDEACTLGQRCNTPIDEDDTRIASFAHRCHCGQRASRFARAAKVIQPPSIQEQDCLMAVHV